MPMQVTRIGCAAANFRVGRPSHLRVEAVVIHIIDGSQQGADATFLSTALDLKRSAHYSVSRTGEIHQYVDENDTAYHCGVVVKPSAALKKGPDGNFINPNFYTIGIEHEGRADDEWPDAMYAASGALLRDIASRHPGLQPLDRSKLILHREIRASKTCPGSRFEMAMLLAAASASSANQPRALRARSNVNVRRGQPTTSAPIARVIPAGEPINVRGTTTGESINGVSRWYENMDGDYIWGGAVIE